MSGPSKVIVLDPDPRAGRQVQLGFEREGLPAVVQEIPAETAKLDLDGDGAGLVLVGGRDGRAVELVRRAKEQLIAKGSDIPIVFTGRGTRRELEAAGADEVITGPVYLRDIVTIARILRDVPSGQRDHLIGSLAETTGVLTLVRALSALGRSAVLTLIRGLRRGEVRFYQGEVTSAQVGLIHGQAALHQLLLWTDARFDFAHEDIVRRQQIPLSADELYADAESFLEGVREHAGNLSPASVLEQNSLRVQEFAKHIPTEVHGVLRLFDGHRVLADILEDSPYRVFETLRVAQKAVDAGLLKQVEAQRPKATWKAVLAIEEWLVGNETRDAVVERTASLDSAPVPSRKRKGKGKRRSKKMKAVTPAPKETKIEANPDIDWGALVPRVIGAEVGSLSGVVPAQEAHGEVDLPTRDRPREGLEALMDTDKRQRIFPTEIGMEPKVVISQSTGDTDEWQRVELEAKERVELEAKERVELETKRAAELEKAKAESDVDTKQGRKKKSRQDVAAQFAAKAKAIAPELVGTRSEPVAAAVAEPAPPPTSKPAEDAREFAARVKAAAEAKRPKDADSAAAAMIAVPTAVVDMTSNPHAAVTAHSDVPVEPRSPRPSGTDAKALVRELVAEAVPTSKPPDAEAAPAPTMKMSEPITVAESATTTVAISDVVTVKGSADTAIVTATPRVLISETPEVEKRADKPAAAKAAEKPAADGAVPVSAEDEPSDGVVRSMIAMADTARLTQSRQRPPTPEHDGPPIKETTGEIRHRTPDKQEPKVEETSIVVADLADAHKAIAAVLDKPAAAVPPPADAASASRELAVSDVRRDAVAFSETEEAFFKKADQTAPAVKLETFDDLDEGYDPPGFWDRVFGRKKKKR